MKNNRIGGYSSFQDDALFIRSVGYCEQDGEYREPSRKIDFGEFFWCTGGSGVFTLGKRRYILHPGEVFFYPPGAVMDFHPGQDGWTHYFITFSGEVFSQLIPTLGITPGKKFCGRVPEDFFKQLISGIMDSDPKQRIPLLGIGMQILFQIAASPKSQQRRQASTAEKAKELIEHDFPDSNFSIGNLAWKLAVHRVTLCREFKKLYGVTPQEFLFACRFSKAIRLLQEEDLTVKEIAFVCGFSSQEYFSTAFSKKFGHPPTSL